MEYYDDFFYIAASEKRKEREIIEQRYLDFNAKINSDEWIEGLEKVIRSKKEKEIQAYVRGVYTTIDKDWKGPQPKYVEGLGPII